VAAGPDIHNMTYENLEIRLLRVLKDDARQSLREMARRLDVAPSTVKSRLEDMEERGVITGYRPEVDWGRLGYGLVAVTRIKARGDRLPAIVDSLVADPYLTHVYEITGDFDVLVIGRFRNEGEMNREIKRMLSLEGIEGTNTSVVLSAPKEQVDVDLDVVEEGMRDDGADG
jgi:DNA-binding Lrp family transcriptional regulator